LPSFKIEHNDQEDEDSLEKSYFSSFEDQNDDSAPAITFSLSPEESKVGRMRPNFDPLGRSQGSFFLQRESIIKMRKETPHVLI
jgi:hypothetical protein